MKYKIVEVRRKGKDTRWDIFQKKYNWLPWWKVDYFYSKLNAFIYVQTSLSPKPYIPPPERFIATKDNIEELLSNV